MNSNLQINPTSLKAAFIIIASMVLILHYFK
jgi:preprotein translocase subunit Sec61beta